MSTGNHDQMVKQYYFCYSKLYSNDEFADLNMTPEV